MAALAVTCPSGVKLSVQNSRPRGFAPAAPRPLGRRSAPSRSLRLVAGAEKAQIGVPALDVAICGQDEGCLIEHWTEAFQAGGNRKRKLVVGGNWKSNGTLVTPRRHQP